MSLRIGLIGAGEAGSLRARALARSPSFRLVAVADPDRDRAARVAAPTSAATFADHRELLDAESVDAVVISTPPSLHERIALDALAAGRHVLCEKPLANRVDACRRMVEAAREARVALATGFNHRYFPPVRRLREAVRSGEIGELAHVRAFTGHVGLPELGTRPWLTDPDAMGGGTLMDNGVHVLDLARCVLGEVSDVSAVVSERVWKIEGCEDDGLLLLRSAEGPVASVHASWTEWRGYRFWLAAYGDRGAAWAWYAPMVGLVVTLDRPGGRAKRRVHLHPRQNLVERFRGWRATVVETFVEELSDFGALVEGGRRGSIAEGFDGFRAVEIAAAARRSSAEGRAIRLCEPF